MNSLGVPLLILAYTSRYFTQFWRGLLPDAELWQRTRGILMTGTAILILLGWDVQIQLWLAPWFPRLPL